MNMQSDKDWSNIDNIVNDYKYYLNNKGIDVKHLLKKASSLFAGSIKTEKDFFSDIDQLVNEEIESSSAVYP